MKKLIFTFLLLTATLFGQTQVGTTETVYTGTKITLTATADGTFPITMTWFKNDVQVSTNISTAASQSSFVNDVLTFNSIQTTDAGTYKVVATNVGGTGESTPVAVIVVTPVGPNSIKIFIKKN